MDPSVTLELLNEYQVHCKEAVKAKERYPPRSIEDEAKDYLVKEWRLGEIGVWGCERAGASAE